MGRNSKTLQLIENFVSKAENVLQTKVSQINSLQNKVDSLNVGVVKEVPAAIDIKETNGNNYATFKSSKIIRDHIESHKKKNANSSDQKSRSNETTKRKLKIMHQDPKGPERGCIHHNFNRCIKLFSKISDSISGACQ